MSLNYKKLNLMDEQSGSLSSSSVDTYIKPDNLTGQQYEMYKEAIDIFQSLTREELETIPNFDMFLSAYFIVKVSSSATLPISKIKENILSISKISKSFINIMLKKHGKI